MRARPSSGVASLVEAPHRDEPCWPALQTDTGSVLLIAADPLDRNGTQHFEAWRSYVGADRATMVFDWMVGQPSQWPLWGRIAVLFGEAALHPLVITAAEREAALAVRETEQARLGEEARVQRHSQVDLFILDPKGNRAGLSLKSGDESSSFFVMRFSEKWERERVLDWLRWQMSQFVAFRDLHDSEGSVALERLIIAGMRETEAQVKARGLSSGGRRPLRFWRGES